MENYGPEGKRIWVTLFDHLDDDMYDGDFSYHDNEIPRILLEYKEASNKPAQASHRVTSSATKTSDKKQTVTTTTITSSITRTNNMTSSVSNTNTISGGRYQQATSSSRTPYEPVAQFEIGDEPTNSNNCNAGHLEEELRVNNQNTIADLRDEQIRRFEIEDYRVNSLGFLERAHQELTGENAQDVQETRRLEGIAHEVSNEISARKTEITNQVNNLKSTLKDVENQTRQTEDTVRDKTKENRTLQDKIDTSEDLNEQGLSQEAKQLRDENNKLKNQFEKSTSDLVKERDERDGFLEEHNQTVKAYNQTIYKFNNLLLTTEQARKIHTDNLHELLHQANRFDEQNDHLEQRLQVTDIDIDSMSQTVDSLRQDLSTTDKIYSEHISELSEIIVQQNREIAELHNSFNDAAARAKNLQTQIEKQKVELAAHEEEMDAIKAIGYEGKVGKLQDDLRNIEQQRRKHQDALENAHEGLTIKLTIFKDQMDERRKKRDHMLGEVSNNLEKLQTVQVTINQLLRELDELINKQASDANKDTVGASLENEKESLGLKLRWASEERDIITRDLQEAIRLTRDKQQEIRDQEDQLRELRRQISDLRVIIEEKKRIIAELEAELEKANERIDYLTTRIRDLDAEIAELERALYERELRIRELSDILGAKPEPEVSYRAVRGDEVDEMLAQYLQDCPVPVKRLGGGFYLFGTRKIFAKIMNGRLVVRVGGGYMFISEFIATYSEPEIAKLTKICENLGIDSIWDLDLEELHYNKGGASPMRSPHGRDSSPKGFGNASFKKSMKGKSGNAALNGTNRQKKFNASAVIR